MDDMKCPECGGDTGDVEKEWDFQQWRVKLCHCNRCGQTIRAYYGDDGELAYTIPKGNENEI